MRISRCLLLAVWPLMLLIIGCGDPGQPYMPEKAEVKRLSLGLEAQVAAMYEESMVFALNSDGSVDTIDVRQLELRFDGEGHALQEELRRNGELIHLTINVLDTAGRLSEVLEYGDDGKLSRSWAYLYGENGRLAEKQGFSAEGRLFEKESRYFDGENRLEQISTNFYERSNSGQREASKYLTEIEYKDNWRITTDTHDGELEKVEEYNEKTRERKRKRFSSLDGSLAETIVFRDSARTSIWTFRKGDGSLKQIEKRVYGPNGMVSDSRFGPDSALYSMELSFYNNAGKIESQRFYSIAADINTAVLDTNIVKPSITRFVYNPDEGADWTEKVSYDSSGFRIGYVARQFIHFHDD